MQHNDGWETVDVWIGKWKMFTATLLVLAESRRQFAEVGGWLKLFKRACRDNVARLKD